MDRKNIIAKVIKKISDKKLDINSAKKVVEQLIKLKNTKSNFKQNREIEKEIYRIKKPFVDKGIIPMTESEKDYFEKLIDPKNDYQETEDILKVRQEIKDIKN